ncbi:class I SAM-dependent methyltransferase [Planomonospora parontospora]|uniref:class I SAM-dependent methyltransferase n=1 Tax=Planomonospora parontospora TaxID=58119 RepID=UPI00166FBAC0|nr:methyltransferase domain-containing protein [Planomonospora parontospora]GGL20494.1 methyltransferase [Planomonospora parontospora subsp. antibiotica]GII13592.1 methyltransferase [Planomonospora parontospora subsp. antibiotica]
MHAVGTSRQPGAPAVRTAVVWDVLRAALADRVAVTGRDRLDIVDAGGGTGGFAVPLAALGHAVTVVDPSPDSLAALERRAAEAGVGVRALQGDAADLGELLPAGGTDLVLCHSVLEYVEDPADSLAAMARLLREGGMVSVLAANPLAAALHRSVSGRFDEALKVLGDPEGRWGDRDPTPRRFTRESLVRLLGASGLRPGEVHGVRVFADLVPSRLLDGEPGAAGALIALEQAAAEHPVLRDIASQLHILGHR